MLDYNEDTENDDYYDIRVHPDDCNLVVVEWEKTPWDRGEWGGSFQWVGVCEEVYSEVYYPNGGYDMVPKGSEDEHLKEWHEHNPDWVLNDFGGWTNMEENRRCSIDFHCVEWANRKEEPHDSTFSLIEAKPGDWDGKTLSEIVLAARPDILYRTGYIVIGKPLLPTCNEGCFKPNEGFKGEERNFGKAGMLTLRFMYKEFIDEPKQVENEIHVYYDERCGGNILYLTDTHYLIARQAIGGEGNEG